MIKIYLKDNKQVILYQDSNFFWSLLDFVGDFNLKFLCKWDDASYILDLEGNDLNNLIKEIDFSLTKIDVFFSKNVSFDTTKIIENGYTKTVSFNKIYYISFMESLKKLAQLAINFNDTLIFDPY